MSLAFVENVEQ